MINPAASKLLVTGAAGLAALALAACGGAPSARPAASSARPAAPEPTHQAALEPTHQVALEPTHQVATVMPSPSPTAPPRRLTKAEAKALYVRLVEPSNTVLDALSRDWTDQLPFAQYQADAVAYIRADRALSKALAAVRWPSRVQPYVTAMRLTDLPASIRCLQHDSAAGSYAAAAHVDATDPDCTSDEANVNANTIRSLLGLPPAS